ncbi:hypothetical protein CONLIGDRAFT_655976 [Coniochaeta ligniaria NRRL 30616]|uniref:Endoplasmic reticulum-based factor for assembly of V-ATPase n=1 Tax=Coniochaeta ligniaria NRRL 30616 TaxID=1408157 RepID=A0A1J7JBL2_9PEZI|nr:hypothetical protein CONLIGDRAFT_655976 [Coniochaeta ligniaria NRRL 30616]
MTTSIVEGLAKSKGSGENTDWPDEAKPPADRNDEPTLDNPAVGQPISHGQIVDLWRKLREAGEKDYTLENLLRGAKVFVPPPLPKPEPSNEYKALMARLRREEEQRAYERMTHPPPAAETFSQRFPQAAMTHAFAEVNRPMRESDTGDDDVTYNDVHRQLMLLLNFVVSILGVAGTLWVVARWWSTPARLFLTMGGSVVVGIAEVAVYQGYLWHLGEAKKKDGKVKEIREVMQTWVVGKEDDAVALEARPRRQRPSRQQRQR